MGQKAFLRCIAQPDNNVLQISLFINPVGVVKIKSRELFISYPEQSGQITDHSYGDISQETAQTQLYSERKHQPLSIQLRVNFPSDCHQLGM